MPHADLVMQFGKSPTGDKLTDWKDMTRFKSDKPIPLQGTLDVLNTFTEHATWMTKRFMEYIFECIALIFSTAGQVQRKVC